MPFIASIQKYRFLNNICFIGIIISLILRPALVIYFFRLNVDVRASRYGVGPPGRTPIPSFCLGKAGHTGRRMSLPRKKGFRDVVKWWVGNILERVVPSRFE